jgi:signal transduction histidine kinase
VTNLGANAVKFTPRGGSVTLSCSAGLVPPPESGLPGEAKYIAIRIADTGPGISDDQLARIFEPFTQAQSGYTREKSGTGLGLTISRRLARLMGGEITVETAEGRGSTFTLWLPRAADA